MCSALVRSRPAQAPHEADEGAQDAQGGEQARDDLGKLQVGVLREDLLIVDVVLHITAQAPLVELLRVHQKAHPLLLHGLAQKQAVLPVGPGSVLRLEHRHVMDGFAEKPRQPAQRKHALHKAQHKAQRDGAVYQEADQVACQVFEEFGHFVHRL